MRNKFEGEAMIFRKDFDDRAVYSTTLSKKKQDGTYENDFIGIEFNKGVSLANKTKIDIKNAWLTFYKNKDGLSVKFIKCSEFEQLSGIPSGFEQIDEKQSPQIPSGFQALEDDDDIPF